MNPFEEDPICKLNLKETAEFVKSLPINNGTQSAQRRNNFINNNNNTNTNTDTVAKRRSVEAPSTPGRPIFGFSVPRKSVPSKWEDAEKWLISVPSSHNDSPAPHSLNKPLILQKGIPLHCGVIEGGSNDAKELAKGGFCKQESAVFSDKSKVVGCEISSNVCLEDSYYYYYHHLHEFNGVMGPTKVPLKDKYTDETAPITPNMRYLEPTNEAMKDASTEIIPFQFQEVKKHRDIGTEMTPLGSSTASRCPTPFMSTSPPRHNTPASRSGPLDLVVGQCRPIIVEITRQLQECHDLGKVRFGSSQFDSVTSNWSCREEEEEEISKSLRHFEVGRRSVSVSESRVSVWEEEEKAKSCLRYQREEAKIQAWLNLQTAKAEAQSMKLEVKIQKMRSELEEKLMKRMANVHRKAEEWRAAAQVEHSEQIRKATERARKHHHKLVHSHFPPHIMSCACFPCTNSVN